jgi:MFS family permease
MELIASVKRRLHYGWVIFGLTFTNLTIEGGAKNSQAVFLVALQNSFQSSATATSAIFSVSGLVAAFSAPFLGRVLDRRGPRFLFPVAGLLILVGWLASSFASDLWQLFIFYGVIATLGQTAVSSFSATANLAPWFPRSRGGMLGLADSGNPTGQAIVTPLSQLIVSTIGWRAAYQIFGVAFFLVAAPLNYLFQRRPPTHSPLVEGHQAHTPEALAASEAAGEDDEDSEVAPGDPPEESKTAPTASALRTWPVWLLFLSRATSSTANQMTNLHIIAFFILAGYGELQAAVTIGLAGLLGVAGRPLFGSLSDFIGRELVFSFGMVMNIGSILVALFWGDGRSLWPLVIFTTLAGLSDGLSGLLIGAKAADLYPPRVLGTVMGLVEMGRGVGIAFGPILGGVLFDWQGNYMVAFTLAALLTFVSICFMWGPRFIQGEARY